MYPRYMQAAERYINALAKVVKPLLVSAAAHPDVQVENEYGSYGNDRAYMKRLRDVWVARGINVPFFTAMVRRRTCSRLGRCRGPPSASIPVPTRSTGNWRDRSIQGSRCFRQRPTRAG
jgi:hypothetical protein